MKTSNYRRDLPDGSKQYFEDRIERPESDQLYYDDVLAKPPKTEGSGGLDFLAFGKEQSYPNRTVSRDRNREYMLHYVTSGSGTFDGKRIGAGEGFLIVPGKPNRMEADSDDPWHFKWIAFMGGDAPRQMKALGLDANRQCFTFSFGDRLEELFDDVLYRNHGDCDLNTYMQGVFYILMSYHKQEYLNSIEKRNGKSGYAQKAIAYMDEHYRESIRIDDIAEKLHISRKYLCSILEQQIGMSTKEYLLNRRAEVAAELLLHTDMSVGEIAAEVGYADYTQFSRMFRKRKGISPRDYAKRHKRPLS
ncbi:MAG: AraC family transcriptional regulator [Clostridia bacterium]|nr:AraC family transcriptional regulator [Clostridia bacterium]